MSERISDPTRPSYKILVPTDFSDSSRAAISYAVTTFFPRLTHLYILHAYKYGDAETMPMVSLVDILREKSERRMSSDVKYAQSLPESTSVDIVSMHRFDTNLNAIVEVAEEEQVDLIVMGYNGRAHPMLDPTREEDTSQLIHHVNRPILLVPKLLN